MGLLAIATFSACVSVSEQEKIALSTYSSGVSVHDPSIVTARSGEYYIFGSHMAVAKSSDLWEWESVFDGVSVRNPLFDDLLSDPFAFDYVGRNSDGGYSIWAPDVMYNDVMGKYVMYFSITSTYVKSNIAFATADSIEGPYSYQGRLIYSGFTQENLEQTNVLDHVDRAHTTRYASTTTYHNYRWPNAIDPALFYDANGRLWMVYGSWSGGIFLLELDQETGVPIRPEPSGDRHVDPYFGIHLLGGNHNSIEGPYIVYDEEVEFYYLFVSYGRLTSEGGYQVRVFRSRDPQGPYTDARGRELDPVYPHAEFGAKLMGNYILPSLSRAYMAPGHGSALIRDDGTRLFVFHVRFDDGAEYHEPRVHQWFVNSDGWPVMAPFAYQGERLQEGGFTTDQVVGDYQLVGFGTDISARIAQPVRVTLSRDGSAEVDGGPGGVWTMKEESPEMTIELDDRSYSGFFLFQADEAGTGVMTFTALSGSNDAVWGMRY